MLRLLYQIMFRRSEATVVRRGKMNRLQAVRDASEAGVYWSLFFKVIWLIGVSGSGKTTLGTGLKKHFEESGKRCYIIDGDLVRRFFDNDLGYSREERVANIKRILLAAHMLDKAGVATIVCNISPCEELREFARRKIGGYSEIYLKKGVAASRADDVKGMYRENLGKTEIVGIDIEFDEPKGSDLVVDVDKESEAESLQRIIEFVQKKYAGEFQ